MRTNDRQYITANFDAGSASDIYWRSLTRFNILKRPLSKKAELMLAAETYWKTLTTLGQSIESQPNSPEKERRRELNVNYQEILIPEMKRLGIQCEALHVVATIPISMRSEKS